MTKIYDQVLKLSAKKNFLHGRCLKIVTSAQNRKLRHEKLLKLIEANPAITDKEIAETLHVSVSTVRLDRTLIGVPELRERLKSMAENAANNLRSLKQSEVIGELLELEPDKWALSILRTAREMAFRFTDIVLDHYIYSQASSIAVAAIKAAVVIIDSMRGEYKGHAHIGDVLIARAKVGVNHEGKKIVSVRTKVKDKEIFVGRFIVEVLE